MYVRSVQCVAALLVLGAVPAFANSFGITGYSGRDGFICTLCHVPTGTAPTVTLNGPATLAPGTSTEYTLTVSGGTGVGVGTDIATNNVSVVLDPVTTDLQKIAGELTHNLGVPFGTGYTFRFRVTAPAGVTSFTIFAAGQRTDG